MKLASQLAKKSLQQADPRVVEYINDLDGWKKLDAPTLSSDLVCPICGGSEHGSLYIELIPGSARVWICHNMVCSSHNRFSMSKATTIPPTSKRAIEWTIWCQFNGIGNRYHDVSFDKIKQSTGKVSYMLKFASKPEGIILMRGDPGTGKTYCSMAICELFTRKDTSCLFTTQSQMTENWLETFKTTNNYIEKVKTKSLLVIDDFGTGEMNPKFLEFFMTVINTRLQWDNRGTIITTNLCVDKFNKFCGEALTDRIMTGQIFEFKGDSRRTKTIL